MAGDWFKFYEDTIHDPKLLKLSDALYRAWTVLLCFASKNGGVLPPADDIATALREKPAKVAEWISKLKVAGLFDIIEGKFIPHNWEGRQYKVVDPTAAERMSRYRKRKSGTVTDRNVTVVTDRTELRLEEEVELDKNSEANASGAEAPLDPSIPEREYFVRGREVLGPKSGAMIANLLKAKGRNVAMARAAIEQASQKSKPMEYIAAICRGPPAVRPTTAHQVERQTGREILDDIDKFIGSGGGETDLGLLRYDPGDGPEGVRGGTGGNLVELSAAGIGKGR